MYRIPARLTMRRAITLLLMLCSSTLLLFDVSIKIPSFLRSSSKPPKNTRFQNDPQDILDALYRFDHPVYEYTSWYRNHSNKDLEVVLDMKLRRLEESILMKEALLSNARNPEEGAELSKDEKAQIARTANHTIHQPITPQQAKDYSTWVAQWSFINPTWKHNRILLPSGSNEMLELFAEDLPELATIYREFEPAREDLLRWMVLWYHGGLYVGHDTWDRIGVDACGALWGLLPRSTQYSNEENELLRKREEEVEGGAETGGVQGEVAIGTVEEAVSTVNAEAEATNEAEVQEENSESQTETSEPRQDISLVLGITTDEPFLPVSSLPLFTLTRSFSFSKAIIFAHQRFDPFIRLALIRSISHSLVHLKNPPSQQHHSNSELAIEIEEISGKHMLTDVVFDLLSETLPRDHELRDWKAGVERRVTWRGFTGLKDGLWIPSLKSTRTETEQMTKQQRKRRGDVKEREEMRGLLVLPINVWGSGQNHSRAGDMDDPGACVNYAPGLRPPG